MATHKRCYKCKTEKETSAFAKDKSRGDGINPQCKECRKDYYKKNREAQSNYGKLRYKENKNVILRRNSQYRKENLKAIAEQAKYYQRNRRANDPTYALIHNLRTRVAKALDGIGKAESSIELLGCTPEQYRHHIESQFVEGMAWNQRGKWHVDHEQPLAAFDLTKPKHQKYAFHWSNCRPMWAEDNLKKSDKHCPKELSTYLKSTLPKYEDIHTL